MFLAAGLPRHGGPARNFREAVRPVKRQRRFVVAFGDQADLAAGCLVDLVCKQRPADALAAMLAINAEAVDETVTGEPPLQFNDGFEDGMRRNRVGHAVVERKRDCHAGDIALPFRQHGVPPAFDHIVAHPDAPPLHRGVDAVVDDRAIPQPRREAVRGNVHQHRQFGGVAAFCRPQRQFHSHAQSSSIIRTSGASDAPMARVFSASRWTPSTGVVSATEPASKKPQPASSASWL